MDSSKHQYQSQQQEIQERGELSSNVACPNCGCQNDLETKYCAECGTGFESRQKECPNCGELNSGVYCLFCGTNVDGMTCPKCTILVYADFCPHCGTPITEIAISLESESKDKQVVTEMSEVEAQAIARDLKSLLTPEMQREQEKLRQRIILLRERQYFQDREERIAQYCSAGGKKIVSISLDEMKRMKNYINSLGGYLHREKVRIKEAKEEEEEKRRQEEKQFAEQRRREQEQRRLEGKHFDGVWVGTSGRVQVVMRMQCCNGILQGSLHLAQLQLERIDSISGSWNGNTVSLRTTSMRVTWIWPGWVPVPVQFSGGVNDAGEIMNGYISSAEYWQEIFLRN